jgi:hypothetical protein
MIESAEFLVTCLGNHFGSGSSIELDTDFQDVLDDIVDGLSAYAVPAPESEVILACNDLDYFEDLMENLMPSADFEDLDWKAIVFCLAVFVQCVGHMRSTGMSDTFYHQHATIQVFRKRGVTAWIRSRESGWYGIFDYFNCAASYTKTQR